MITYTLLAILYLITCLGYYKLLKAEPIVVQAYNEAPALIFTFMLLFSIAWPLVSVVNYGVAGLRE